MRKALAATVLGASLIAAPAFAATVKVTLEAKEHEIAIDNKGTKYAAWTFGDHIPGPVIRAKEGDTIEVTLVNPASNKNSHSIDLHAAVVDVLDEFAPVRPGEKKTFSFTARYPGVFMYHCGADPMHQHIARGMYGIVIVDPKEGYTKNFPKPDREYVLVQGQFFPDAEDHESMLVNEGWTNSLINGKIFHYDPVHDPNASLALQARPGELVRIHYVNANVNLPAAIHPIAGIWERVYENGNPRNVLYGMQTYHMGVSEAASLDIVSPKDRNSNYAIVDHAMGAALRGAISVLMVSPDADSKIGKDGNLILR